MLYRFARFLQLVGLILIPLAVAGNLTEFANPQQALTLKQSLLMSGIGIVCFGLGWYLQQQVKPS